MPIISRKKTLFMQRLSSWRAPLAGAIVLASLTITGCNKNASSIATPPPGNEFLTTVELQLTNTANAADVQTCTWTQMSPYTNTYQVDSTYSGKAFLKLKANSTYACKVILLDQTQNPVANISDEILARENYHLFFFQPSPVAASSVIVSDTSTSIPMTDWQTAQSPSDTTAFGTSISEVTASSAAPALNLWVERTDLDTNNPPLQIGLQDNVYTGAASNGILRFVLRHQPNAKNGTYAPGSTDLDVTYAVSIQ